ncbi:unnamed protein product [Adineta steineri]|uniref:Uncharacterized protein n=2 Tax=Adineta steineri TaxID=433720 RepID=A0A815PAV3_9BILA|nr:unnamed protein product [Adineta steineri]CAF4034448.1 unnamed protein product [Adineta steineri]
MTISMIHSLLITLIIYQQGVVTDQHPIGPTFISTIVTKQKLYYSNLGTRLDCLATGNPLPKLTWFRTNSSDIHQLISIQSSDLIDLYENGSLFIRPFREYFKTIHSTSYICRAENSAGSIQTIPIQVKPQIYDAYEIEVKNPYGFEQSSAIISCEISPPLANLYVHIIGWLEKINNDIFHLDLKPKTKYNLLSNKNLIIHNLTKSDDNRSYACLVNNQIDNNTRQSRFKSLRIRDRSPFGPELSIPNNTEYQAQIGDIIELPCGISSLSPNAHISWWKDGIEISNLKQNMYNNSFIIQLSTPLSNESGNYICHVDDESIGRMTSMISLKVNVPTQCHMNFSERNINAGSTIEFICTINSIKNTSVQWQWYHNSVLLSSKLDQYVISNVTREHMGMYQCCFVSNSLDLNSCCAQTQIRIINSPPFIFLDQQTQSNSIIILSENKSRLPIDLNCTVYGDPIPEINLFKDGQKLLINNSIEYLSSGDIFLHYPIYISNISDTGLYECRAKNSLGSISLTKHININKQKPFIQPLTNLTVRTGQQFTVPCYASGQPNLYLQWIDKTHNQIINTSTISPILFTAINTNSNIYVCQAINSYGQTFLEIFTTVQIPAKILSITTNLTIKINEYLNIFCYAEGDNELESKLINPSAKKLNTIVTTYENKKNLSIIINNIQMSDSGLYECYVKNNYSEDRSIFKIIVQNIPDRIEQIVFDNSERISWMKPFDGNSKIINYILRIQYKQDLLWSNETIITIDNDDITTYSFENIYSICSISVIIQAVNKIGSSLPSQPFYFQTNMKRLHIAPYNLKAGNISSKSAVLTWQYPSFHICNDSYIEFIIEVTDQYNQTHIQTHSYHSTTITIHQLKSFTYYTFMIYAINDLGPSPISDPLKIQTLESVPLAIIRDLTGSLLNSSTAYITWMFEQDDFQYLNGKFRTFAITTYENFNMSTLRTIETTSTEYFFDNLNSSSQYHISVAICNFLDCGSSSLATDINTPSSSSNAITIIHPINKPLGIDCSLSTNNSISISHPLLSKTESQYRCGSKLYNIRYYSKPSFVRATLHYTLSNEIGLKISYPSEIIESITISYKIQDTLLINELNIFPPLLNVRLTNLSCGSFYEIMIYGSNQAGFSLTDYLIARTDGSVPTLIESSDLVQTVSNNYIILNMANWIINECSILSYEIELLTSKTNLSRYFSYKNDLNELKIDNLQSNEDYQLNIKVNSQAGENMEIISFRTTNEKTSIKSRMEQFFILIICLLLIFILISFIVKFSRRNLRKTDLFINQKRKLKPVLCTSNSTNFRKTWSKTDKDFTIENYVDRSRSNSFVSEDSQGNINPYAVTGYAMNCKDETNHESIYSETKHQQSQLNTTDTCPSSTHTERYFRPIILENSLSNEQDLLKRNPLIQIPDKSLLPNVHYTISPSHTEIFSAFTYVSSSSSSKPKTKKSSHNDQSSSSADSGVHSSDTQSPRYHLHNFTFDHSILTNQNDPLYVTYDETTTESSRHQHYSLV